MHLVQLIQHWARRMSTVRSPNGLKNVDSILQLEEFILLFCFNDVIKSCLNNENAE